jgi:hypothetical protein
MPCPYAAYRPTDAFRKPVSTTRRCSMGNRFGWVLSGAALGLAAVLAACGEKAPTPAPAPGPGGGTAEASKGPSSEPAKALSENDRLILKGKEDWASCGTCHGATDPRIPQDDDWVVMNEETT